MKLRAPIILVALFGLLSWPPPANAQDITPERVQLALETTDHRIEQAQMLLSGTEDERAQLEVNAAVDLQTRAKAAFAQSPPQLRLAMGLTLEARGHADRAIALIRGLPDPDRVLVQLERTSEILERVRERISECDNDRAHALLRVALSMQVRAEEAAQSGHYLAALQLTMSARERAFRALRLCNLEEDRKDSAERALRRTDDVISRAQDTVAEHGNEQARQVLARAVELQSRATAEFHAEHYEASLRLTLAARAMAHRAVRLAGAAR